MSDTTRIFQQVRDAARIEDLIGEYITLRPAGRELVGLCPFHDDRRPSMYVSPRKQIYYCFVCAAGGDVFRFVRNYHKMTAGEALRFLAQRYGVPLPEYHGPRPGAGGEESSRREKMLAANAWAAKYFQENLAAPGNQAPRAYLQKRGLTAATIHDFQLGFAADSWSALAQAAARQGVQEEPLLATGLLKRRADGTPFDALRNRIIFPIHNLGDQLIGFGGRILPEAGVASASAVSAGADAAPPKYLNSPETVLFSKRETLYALPRARPAIIRAGSAVVVEGYMDVLACHQCGVTHVVATLGTALTERHIGLLRRFCDRVILVFDSDEAGRRAADRAIELLLPLPLDVRITHVPGGKDPCDFCMAQGGEAFGRLLAEAEDALEYKWRQFVAEFQATGSLARKQEASTAMLRLVAAAVWGGGMDPIRRGLLEKQLADLIGLSVAEVHQMIRRLGRPSESSNFKSQIFNTRKVAPGGVAASAVGPPPVRRLSGAGMGRRRAEQWILGALLCDFSLYREFHQDMALALFEPGPLAELAAHLWAYLEGASDLEHATLADFLGQIEDPVLLKAAMEAQAEAQTGGYTAPADIQPDRLERGKLASAEEPEETPPDGRDQLRQKISDALAWLKRQSPAPQAADPSDTDSPGGSEIDLSAALRRAQEIHRPSLSQRPRGGTANP